MTKGRNGVTPLTVYKDLLKARGWGRGPVRNLTLKMCDQNILHKSCRKEGDPQVRTPGRTKDPLV